MKVNLTQASRMAAGNQEDMDLLLAEGVMCGFTDGADGADGADRSDGEANWVGYLPSCGRAVAVSNGDPVWYDARSLADAVRRWRSHDEDLLRN